MQSIRNEYAMNMQYPFVPKYCPLRPTFSQITPKLPCPNPLKHKKILLCNEPL